jgi:hypothetical protein
MMKTNARLRWRGSRIVTAFALVSALSLVLLASSAHAEGFPRGHWYGSGVPITSSQPITWKGTYFLRYKSGPVFTFEVACEDSGTGSVGSNGGGKTTTWTFSGCKNFGPGSCSEASLRLEAPESSTELLNEAFIGRGLIWKNVVSGYVEVKCGGKFYDKCNAASGQSSEESPKNTSEGVTTEETGQEGGCVAGTAGIVSSYQKFKLAGGVRLEAKV